MQNKTIMIVGLGVTCLLFQSLQAIAKEAGFTLVEAKDVPREPRPDQKTFDYLVALVDTRRPTPSDIAQFFGRGDLSSRQLKRMRRSKRGVPNDTKTQGRMMAMKHKSRR
jgi:hypothetical protein